MCDPPASSGPPLTGSTLSFLLVSPPSSGATVQWNDTAHRYW